MDNTVIQNNYPKAKKRVKWAIFLYIKQDKIMVSFFQLYKNECRKLIIILEDN